MIDFTVTLPTYDDDEATKKVWAFLETQFPSAEGMCYYKHPVLMTPSGVTPELILITPTHQPLVLRCLPYQVDEIDAARDASWVVNGIEADSPILEAEDFVVVLKSKFERIRMLRNRLSPIYALALPLISHRDFKRKFPGSLDGERVLWAQPDLAPLVEPLTSPLSDTEWRQVRSIVQGVSPLTKGIGPIPSTAITLGDAIRYIDRYIALLDEEQAKAALQIAPGPQRVRGLAGTGKTVLLAMKAANVHLRYPEKKILFTFNTQSLYNQTRTLISKFYRFNSDVDPDWDRLHVRHAWGGSSRPGVYYDVCARLGIRPLTLTDARAVNRRAPFRACCQQALAQPIDPEYDFIMVDEAQDFPAEFFQILFRLSHIPHQIYWVYDELQSLFAEQVPSPEELFGHDDKGKPLVSMAGDPYPGGIERDLVLHRSYRCPQPVLMLAHAIGLGLYSPHGCVQMLSSKESWEALGYVIQKGKLKEGTDVTIFRPPENSPNPITQLYTGPQPVVRAELFNTRDEELDWLAQSIQEDIAAEQVAPENIVVICLDALKMRDYLPLLQKRLINLGLASSIPGLVDDSAAFAEPGRITLSTVFRAKGNESYIVYIFTFDALYDYVEELQNRNRAFTAISRSKAWVRITGIGEGMRKAKSEIDAVLADQPVFHFRFPSMKDIRNLDAETDRRRREIRRARETAAGLVGLDAKALEALATQDPELFNTLSRKIDEAKRREAH